jgi:HSP20 family protein
MSSFQEMLLSGLSNMHPDSDLVGVIRNVVNTGVGVGSESKWNPCTDIVDTKENLYVYMEIPGVKKESISVDFCNNKLCISGEKVKNYVESPTLIRTEILYGQFSRTISLPISVTNRDNVSVQCNNGFLTLIIDKQKEEQNRFTININNSNAENEN